MALSLERCVKTSIVCLVVVDLLRQSLDHLVSWTSTSRTLPLFAPPPRRLLRPHTRLRSCLALEPRTARATALRLLLVLVLSLLPVALARMSSAIIKFKTGRPLLSNIVPPSLCTRARRPLHLTALDRPTPNAQSGRSLLVVATRTAPLLARRRTVRLRSVRTSLCPRSGDARRRLLALLSTRRWIYARRSLCVR